MANYPTSVSTNANLYIAVNGLQTTLAVACTSGDTTLTLTSTTSFPTTGLVTIDNTEIVSYTGVAGATLTGCTRGADGTTAAAHPIGVTVGLTVVAAHHNLLKDEVIAIETALGANLANVFPATPTTGSGNVVLQTSPTINSPILVTPALGTPASGVLTNATGLPLTTGVTGVLPNANTTATPNATASTIVSRDANANTKVNTVVENFTTTVTAAGTTALTAATSPLQQFTGTTTQTVTLPDATTLSVGYQITILNRSTGIVTVNNNGAVLQQAVPATAQTTFTCTNVGSANGTWDVSTSSASGLTSYREDYVVGTALNNYTGSLTVFNLVTPYSVGAHSLVVTLDGDVQTIGATIDYQETNSTTVTFNNALVSGEKVSFIFQTATSSGGTVNSGTAGQLAYFPATGPTVSGTNDPTGIASINSTFIGMGRNRLINGAMTIDQRNEGALVTINTTLGAYGADRWGANGTPAAGVFKTQRLTTTPPTGHTHYTHVTVTTADASPAASSIYLMYQMIEGYNWRDFQFGTANAKTFTASFWVKSSQTGQFGGVFKNYNASRDYAFIYTVNAANTWEQKSITVAGDTTGTWIPDPSGTGMFIIFNLGCGSTFLGTPNVWGTTNIQGATGDTKVIASTSNTWDITGVQIEMGSQATAFEFTSLPILLMQCQRYYEKSYDLTVVPGTATGAGACRSVGANTQGTTYVYNSTYFEVRKRVTPTLVFYTPAGTAGSITVTSNTNVDSDQGAINITNSTSELSVAQNTAGVVAQLAKYQWTADADI